MADRALVKNAADERQVKNARRYEQRRQNLFEGALRTVLTTVEGRLVLSELLDQAGLYASVYDHSGSLMYFKEGRRNFGLELRALLERVDEPGTDTMDRERRARLRRDAASIDASHTASAETVGEDA